MRLRLTPVAVAIAAALPSLASAVDFSYNGFATAAYSQTDTDEAQVNYVSQPEAINSDGTFKIDSKIGLQVTAKFNEYVSATVQGVAYADLKTDWEPRLDWAYLAVKPLSSVTARAGYLRAPTFMFSDSVFIGYANTWVRPPLEVYNLSPLYQLRGVDVTWRGTIGPVAVSLNPYFGDGESEIGSGATLDMSEWSGAVATAQYGSFNARFGYTRLEYGAGLPELASFVSVLRSFPAQLCGNACAAAAKGLDLKGTILKIYDLGGQYDDGDNVAIVEYAARRSGSYLSPDAHSAYATYGRRIGSFTPYATYAIARRDEVNAITSFPQSVGFLAGGVNGALSVGLNDQDSYSAGVRYELPSITLLKGSVVKLQFDHIDVKDGIGNLGSVQPGFDGSVNMISASFDFIF